ncbi:MAG: (Fe-S)-binding protein [Flavobacteriales bacterium]|nr:(Fe-S)-binding protein [Flavobacteriales bacterium]MDG1779996.1 (Fe-S)-binding protein [Flavobacteriales bacterium]MDG2247446.1 (Fe-S)-binding protein [Flavobacteriales bacterium]
MIAQILFLILLGVSAFFFARRIGEIRRNIKLGRDIDRSDNSSERWKTMFMVAIGQSKMVKRPIAGILHILVYVGFILINIEVLEIIIDGLFGTHRVFATLGAGAIYDFLIGCFEILAFLVLVACVIFLVRRNVINIKRFHSKEMTKWPKSDANIILVTEVLLMFALLSMNATDAILQERAATMMASGQEVSETLSHYIEAGSFPVSAWLVPLYDGMSVDALMTTERFMWWFHIIGILGFLVYVPYSKHFHIFLAFPNTYYSKLLPKGELPNMEAVTNEVKLMLDPNADPFAAPAPDPDAAPIKFGAKDVQDLTWKQLFDSYTCTECGRCTSVCPANQTGKLLSPRKIMMDTRDRLDEVGKGLENGAPKDDGKSLLRDYISEEELWACTTCNACVEACPVNIDPVSIIIDLRRHLIMEESKSPESITAMFNNVENNGAPWAFPAADRGKWIEELNS